MSATTSGAIKAYLEHPDRSLGFAIYRDRAPKDAVLPLAIVQEAISVVPRPMGDTYDQTAERTVEELAQVALYQVWRTPDGKGGEKYTLSGDLYKILHGALLPDCPPNGARMVVQSQVRLPGVDGPKSVTDSADGANVVAVIYTVTVHRSA